MLDRGECEPFKCGWHVVLAVLACGAFGYNAAAFILRREPHLAVNAAVYGGLIAFEVCHVRHHRERVT